MPRPKKTIRPVQFHCNLPEDLKAALELSLWSTVEGRVPQGAYQEFLCDAIRRHLEERKGK
jgi:hypothetical protein